MAKQIKLKQGDVVWVEFPFKESPTTTKKRPALIISNSLCHDDGELDYIFIPITKTERLSRFSYVIDSNTLMRTLPFPSCEIRTNKIFTINKSLTFECISEVKPDRLSEILELVFSALKK